MRTTRTLRLLLGALLVVCLGAAVATVYSDTTLRRRTHLTAFFDNSNGIFVGDNVRIMGVAVGEIDRIVPHPDSAEVGFWVDAQYRIPAGARAVILAPSLVSVRAIQLTPAYTGGPTLNDNAVITQDRTVVPMEWDDLRAQLEKLTATLQPTAPGGVSTLGAFVNTAADNVRGQGGTIRDTLTKLASAFAALGDGSDDIFSTVKHLQALVAGLQSSSELLQQLNGNLADVTGVLANDPDEISQVVTNLNSAVGDVRGFLAGNSEVLGSSTEHLTALTQTVAERIDDLKQALHVTPNTLANYANIYSPATGSTTGILALNNFANPIEFICGSIQAASRLNAEQSAKLCTQYLAPIVKNRQYNFLPVGTTINPLLLFPIVGANARPNEITYSDPRLRPDNPPAPPPVGPSTGAESAAELPGADPGVTPPPETNPAEQPAISTNPQDGLAGVMVPTGGGS